MRFEYLGRGRPQLGLGKNLSMGHSCPWLATLATQLQLNESLGKYVLDEASLRFLTARDYATAARME